MIILPYIAKMTLATGLIWAYYWFFLRNRQFHRYNRYYLLIAVSVALAAPFLSVPLRPRATGAVILVKTLQVIIPGNWGETDLPTAAVAEGHNWLTISGATSLLYALGVFVCLSALVRSLINILRIRRKYRYEVMGKVRLYNTAEPGTPFSFFRLIFWNRNIPLDNAEGQQIFRHEIYHVNQGHSSDILFMELLCCIAWFNPFLHLIKKELKAIHEFLADEYAISRHDRTDYAELLVTHAIRQKNTGLTHPFSQHEIKRRIIMITQSNPLRHTRGYFSRVMVLPLLLVLFSAFAVRLAPGVADPLARWNAQPLTVIIDAGHGGMDPGAQTKLSKLAEKDLALAMALKVNELAGQYGVNVILTRNSDILPGNAINKREGLEKRVEIAIEKKADLFISLHVNQGSDPAYPQDGFIAFVSGRKTDTNSAALAAGLLAQLTTIYKTSSEIRRRPDAGIYVLDKSRCPAVILECGNLGVPQDVRFISNSDNQEKIARNILQGILQYQKGDK
jgi:N-acetylmuramoyl-L-alanine amidase